MPEMNHPSNMPTTVDQAEEHAWVGTPGSRDAAGERIRDPPRRCVGPRVGRGPIRAHENVACAIGRAPPCRRHLLTCKANRLDRRALQVVTRHAAEEVRASVVGLAPRDRQHPRRRSRAAITDGLCLGSTIRDFAAEPARNRWPGCDVVVTPSGVRPIRESLRLWVAGELCPSSGSTSRSHDVRPRHQAVLEGRHSHHRDDQLDGFGISSFVAQAPTPCGHGPGARIQRLQRRLQRRL